jgi:hypothetical protein
LLNVTGEVDAAMAAVTIAKPVIDMRSTFIPQASFGVPSLLAMISQRPESGKGEESNA